MKRREFIRVKSVKGAVKMTWTPKVRRFWRCTSFFTAPFFISTKRFVRHSAAAARSLTKMFPECFDFVVKKTSFLSLFRIKKTVHFMCTVFWWRIAPVTRTLYSLQECILNHVRIAMILFFQKRFDRFSYDLRLRNTLADALCLEFFDHCLR